MLFDGINLVEGSTIQNASIASGSDYPLEPDSGELFYIDSTSGGNEVGLHVYSLGQWSRIVQQGDSLSSLLPSNTTPGTYKSVTVDAKGLVTSGTNPTTLGGYGIADAQPLDADLTAIAALVGVAGFLKKTGANTWTLDTASYLTSNENISLSGDASGSGTTSITVTLADTGVAPGTFGSATATSSVVVDSKGRITNASQVPIAVDATAVTSGSFANSRISQSSVTQHQASLAIAESQITDGAILARVSSNETISGTWTFANTVSGVTPQVNADLATKFYVDNTIANNTISFASLTGKPTTLTGYGITDALNKNGDTLVGNLAAGTGTKFTMADAPISGIDVTNKNYVDSAIAGLSWKQSVTAKTTGDTTLYGLQTIDGMTLVDGNRVLVASQTDATQNGIYVASSGAWTRSTDANSNAEFPNAAVFVNGGFQFGDSGWTCGNDGVTLGTTSIFFVQFNGAQGITAGIGLLKTGNVLDVNLGAGISQLPTDEVGVDVYATGGLMLTVDGTTSSTNTAAKLALSASGVTAGTYNNVTVDIKGRVTTGSNASYLTGNQSITVSGDATGSGSTSIALTLANSGVTAGTYGSASSVPSITVDAKGRITSVGANPVAPVFSNITSKPTTLAGYGITDAVSNTATIAVANGGTGATTAENACTNIGASRINPTTPKDGDIRITAGPVISVYATGAYRQIFPAVYS